MHLVIDTDGIQLRVRDGCFELRQEGKKQHIAPPKVASITLSARVMLSSEAIHLALQHQIPLIFTLPHGQPQGMVWSHRYGSIATLRQKQLRFVDTPEAGEWVRQSLLRRLHEAIQLLEAYPQASGERDRADIVAFLQQQRSRLQGAPLLAWDTATQAHWRGLEGSAMRRYYPGLAGLLPPHWQFTGRSRRPAQDAFNAVLNYLYGTLYQQLEWQCLRVGLDPYLGMMHRTEYARASLTFDLIEGFRHWVERVALDLFRAESLSGEHFRQESEGWWINRSAKKVILPLWHEFLAEKISDPTTAYRYSRQETLQRYCQALAQEIQLG